MFRKGLFQRLMWYKYQLQTRMLSPNQNPLWMPALPISCQDACISWWKEEPKINRGNRSRFWGVVAANPWLLRQCRPSPNNQFPPFLCWQGLDPVLAPILAPQDRVNPGGSKANTCPRPLASYWFRGEWPSSVQIDVWISLLRASGKGSGFCRGSLSSLGGSSICTQCPVLWQPSRGHEARKCQGWQHRKMERNGPLNEPIWNQATSQLLVMWENGFTYSLRYFEMGMVTCSWMNTN